MTPADAMAIIAHMNTLRDKIRDLIADRDDLRMQLADITAERDQLRADLDEALCINDQQQEAAEARRYGRSLT